MAVFTLSGGLVNKSHEFEFNLFHPRINVESH